MKKLLSLLLALSLIFSFTACADLGVISSEDGPVQIYYEDFDVVPEDTEEVPEDSEISPEDTEDLLPEDGWYYSAEDVALYLVTYGYLPSNFITKDEARDLGWEGGSVEKYAPGFAIGGDKFGNREGLLPKADGRQYYECDIDTDGASSRGAKRLVFSNDGLIFYTDDHYESFTLLYGEE